MDNINRFGKHELDDTETNLIMEIDEWKKKIEEERPKVILAKEEKKNFLENIDAYIKDSQYFLEQKDYVRSFEALVWAWAWLEIGKKEGFLKE